MKIKLKYYIAIIISGLNVVFCVCMYLYILCMHVYYIYVYDVCLMYACGYDEICVGVGWYWYLSNKPKDAI